MDSTTQAQSIVGYSPGRPAYDFYETPENATLALLGVEDFPGGVWECACGLGAISKVLRHHGIETHSTDLVDRGAQDAQIDFMMTSQLHKPNIVTNPPFTLALDFVEHAVHYLKCEKLALLLKLAFLEGGARSKALEITPLRSVYVFRKRLNMYRYGEEKRGSGLIAFAWYVWEKGYTGKPMVEWIP